MFFPSWQTVAGQIQGKALFQESISLLLQSSEAAGVSCIFVSQGPQRHVACKIGGSIWHLIQQNITMLPLLITVMLQETEEGACCVWRHRRMEKWGVIKEASSQNSLLETLCVCVSLWPLSEGANKIVLYCSTSLPSNNGSPPPQTCSEKHQPSSLDLLNLQLKARIKLNQTPILLHDTSAYG